MLHPHPVLPPVKGEGTLEMFFLTFSVEGNGILEIAVLVPGNGQRLQRPEGDAGLVFQFVLGGVQLQGLEALGEGLESLLSLHPRPGSDGYLRQRPHGDSASG